MAREAWHVMDEELAAETGGSADTAEGADEAEAWYFDLPQGAWERQEQKNRTLRQTVKQNISHQEEEAEAAARRDPFRHRNAPGRAAPPEPTWRLNPPGSPQYVPETPAAWNDDDVAWEIPEATADELAVPAPVLQMTPILGAEEAWEEGESVPARNHDPEVPAPLAADEAMPWSPPTTQFDPIAADADGNANGEESLMAMMKRDTEPGREAPAPPAAPAEPLSRWDEMFSAPAGESMVDAMRAWSAKEDANDPPDEMLKPFDWEDPAAESPAAPPSAKLTPMEAELEEWLAVAAVPAVAAATAEPTDLDEWPTELPEGAFAASEAAPVEAVDPAFSEAETPALPVEAFASAAPWGETLPGDDTELHSLVGGPRPGLLKRLLLGKPSKMASTDASAAHNNRSDDGSAWLAPPAVAWPANSSDLAPHGKAAASDWQVDDGEPGADGPATSADNSESDDRPATFGAWLVPEDQAPVVTPAEAAAWETHDLAEAIETSAPDAWPVALGETEGGTPDSGVNEHAILAAHHVTDGETPGPENALSAPAEADSEPVILHAESVSNEPPPRPGRLWPEDDDDAGTPWTFEQAEDSASATIADPFVGGSGGAPPGPPDSPPTDQADDDDDPWAAFMSARESEGPVPFASPATATPGAPVSWGTSTPESPTNSGDDLAPETSTDEDDPWAAVVAASGYDDTPAASSQVYFKRRDGSTNQPVQEDESRDQAPDATPDPRGEIERRLFEPEPLEWNPAPEPEPAPSFALSEASEAEWLSEPFAPAEAPVAAPTPGFWEDDNDVVLRAFLEKANEAEEEHQASGPDEAEPGPLDALFGRQASAIEAELNEPELERPSFAQAPPWAQPRVPGSSQGVTASLQRVVEPDEWTPPPLDPDGRFFGPQGREPLPFGGDDEDADRHPVAGAARSRGKTLIRELVETGLLALLVFLAVRASFQNFKVDGNSMFPTLENGQFLIVNKLVYSEVDLDKLSGFLPFVDVGTDEKRHVFHPPERGDIIVLRDPRRPETDLIKRVVGLPGETIEIVDGKVAINGFRLEEPYITTQWHYNMPKTSIPIGQYFVMGDNRDNSLDSRSAQVGPVPEELIIGKTFVSYWPSSKFGLAPNGNPQLTEEPLSSANRVGKTEAAP